MANHWKKLGKWAWKKAASVFRHNWKWTWKKIVSFFKRPGQPRNKKIILAKYLAVGAIGLAIVFIIFVVITISNISWGGNRKTENSKKVVPKSGKRNTLAYGVQILKPGVRYYFNRADTFRVQLSSAEDTLPFKKEGYEKSVYWDMVYDADQKRVFRANDHDDRSGWGNFYVRTNKEIRVDVYKPSSL
jgi:hypothetical protein